MTKDGEQEFERLMTEISSQPVRMFLDFNAVIVNLDSLPPKRQRACISEIENKIKELKMYLEENVQAKEHIPEIPATGMAVLKQQLILAEAIEAWISSLKSDLT